MKTPPTNSTPPQSESASTTRVSFQVDGSVIVGDLRVPSGSGPHPALIFDGPLTSVKEQATGNYAAALAERGFITIAIDHRHFGQSGGSPRFLEDPNAKCADSSATIDYLLGREDVDPARIGAVGICAGAGYMSALVANDPRVRAWGTVAGFFHDNSKQREWMGDSYEKTLETARVARLKFETTGESDEIPAVGDGDEDVAMPMTEAFQFYGTERGANSNYTNAFAVMSREKTLPWDSMGAAAKIRVPTLMIHSEKALSPALARKFFGLLAGEKTELWVESEGQIDFYDRPARIEPAADALAAHFRATHAAAV